MPQDEVKPGSKDEVMDSMRAQAHADPDNASACLQRYLALQQSTGEKMAALTEENNDLATRLVDVTLQLAQLKEEQVRPGRRGSRGARGGKQEARRRWGGERPFATHLAASSPPLSAHADHRPGSSTTAAPWRRST